MGQNHLKVGVCQLSLTANEMLVFVYMLDFIDFYLQIAELASDFENKGTVCVRLVHSVH